MVDEDVGKLYLTMGEMCQMLHISANTAREMMRAGEITGCRIHNKKWLFKRSDIEAYLEANCSTHSELEASRRD
jgi:excisionase family DNA binding protein